MQHYELLVCLHCTENAGGDPLVMPFGTVEEMRAWWRSHREATGHRWSWQNDAHADPTPHEAARLALAYMAENAESAPSREPGRVPETW